MPFISAQFGTGKREKLLALVAMPGFHLHIFNIVHLLQDALLTLV